MKLRHRPPFLDDPEFAEWQKRAAAARDKMVEAKKRPDKFNEKLYQEFKKDFLTKLGFCAYCEGRYDAGEFGDAEHYRPKSEVTQSRMAIKHDGYYWLAYEWQNLLLACKKCNSTHPDRDNSTKKNKVSHPGKLCEFPVAGQRITEPSDDPDQWIADLCQENPLLLHPYYDSYEEHFEAKLDGWIYPRTERGRITIEICDLNRKELRHERRAAEQYVEGKVAIIWNKHLTRSPWKTDVFTRDAAYPTYLNCKVREELKRKSMELHAGAESFGFEPDDAT